MQLVNSFTSTRDRVAPVVTTTVAGSYLMNARGAPTPAQEEDSSSRLDRFRCEVTPKTLRAASTIERVLAQVGERPDRIVRSRGGGIAFIFLAKTRYAMLESDEDGVLVVLLSDRSTDSEAETWVVASGELTEAVRKIRTFVGPQHRSTEAGTPRQTMCSRPPARRRMESWR